MARRRQVALRPDMGEALSIGDVLSLLTVILVLRVVFMIPLVNLDKAKTVAARTDAFFAAQVAWLAAHSAPADSAPDGGAVRAYRDAFRLEGKRVALTRVPEANCVYLEALAPDSGVMVLKHSLNSNRFIALRAQKRGDAVSYRWGRLLWSAQEGEWFPASDSVDYGLREESKAMQREFRAWTRGARGY